RLLRAAVAAEPFDIAADRDQAVEGPERLHASAERVDAVAADEDRGAVGVEARRGDDVGGGDARVLFGDLGRESRDALAQSVEAEAPTLDESAVVEILGDEDIHHRKPNRSVRSRARPKPEIGELRCRRAFRVEDDDAPAALLQVLKLHPLARIGGIGIAPDDQGTIRVLDVLAACDVEAGHAPAHAATAAAEILI